MQDVVQNMFDSFPEEEELKDFDTFFIGDGSKSLMNKTYSRNKRNTNSQLTGIFSVDDLSSISSKEVDSVSEDEDDIVDLIPSVSVDSTIDGYFFEIKKSVFSFFGFLEIKSKRNAGRPFRERDLILSHDDKYLLSYLKGIGVDDYGVYNSIAQLKALAEMGFSEVRFIEKDGCPLCGAFDGSVYSIDHAISVVGSGKPLVHENCICNYAPVIRDRSVHSSVFSLNKDKVYVGETLVVNLPLEYQEELCDIIGRLSYSEIIFDSSKNIKSSFDIDCSFACEVDSKLYVSLDYFGNYCCVDYLLAWESSFSKKLNIESELESRILSGDIYYFNGYRVVEVDGVYFDVESKERVS